MQADQYQQEAAKFAQYPRYSKLLYPILGAVGELGELVSLFFNAMWPYGLGVPEGQEKFHEVLLALLSVSKRCETLKKEIRGDKADLTEFQKEEILDQVAWLADSDYASDVKNEVGDVCWYLSAVLTDLGVTLSDTLQENLQKLGARKRKNAIHDHQPDSKDHKE